LQNLIIIIILLGAQSISEPVRKAAVIEAWKHLVRYSLSKRALYALGDVLVIISLGCSVISMAFVICRFIFFTYAVSAGLHYSCKEYIL
jgi:hypothetical protein